jgi:16S rRNA (guanine1207-N2)-methyltransferase
MPDSSDIATRLLADALLARVGASSRVLWLGHGAAAFVRVAPSDTLLHVFDRGLPTMRVAEQAVRARALTEARVVHAARPDDVARSDARYTHVALCITPDRRVNEDRVAWAVALSEPGATVLLAGANREGARTAAETLSERCGGVYVVAQKGGTRCVEARVVDASHELPTEIRRELAVQMGGDAFAVVTRPGVFSWEHLDHATALLCEALAAQSERVAELLAGAGTQATILDVGCGAGALGVWAARRFPRALVTLCDVDADALRCAAETSALAGVADRTPVIADDVAESLPDASVDLVLTNPPFHVGKATDFALPSRFMRQSARVLRAHGELWLVANRTLPYEAQLRRAFARVDVVAEGRGFKVLRAAFPA